MAELNYDHGPDAEAPQLPPLSRLVNIAGAVISLSLIAGLGWWGYQLMVRDVSGVPVVRALEGPMRIAPDDPGGEAAEHQGLAVNNIPAMGEAAPPADRLVLAPAPEALAEEDLPTAEIRIEEDTALANPGGAIPTAAGTDTGIVADAGTGSGADSVAAAQSEIDSLIDQALSQATGLIEGPGGKEVKLVPASTGGLKTSLVPTPRPEGLAAPRMLAVDDDGVRTVAPGDIPAGTRLAQLGAFDSAADARAEWVRLATRFPEYMTDKARVIEAAQSGGRQFYRLRAHGFQDLADARRFCAPLTAAGLNCIPVRQR